MYIDTQTTFSTAQAVSSAVGDIVSTNVYDTGAAADVGNGTELVILAGMVAALVGVGASIQVVLQDSADNASFADVQVAPAVTTANAIAGRVISRMYVPIGTRRYLRLVYRISGATTTGGTVNGFLILDDVQYNVGYRSGVSAT